MSGPVRAYPTQADVVREDGRLAWKVGDVLMGMYRIEAIRSGGMGVVCLCRAVGGDAGCAIKTVMIDPLLDERLRALMRTEAECWLGLGRHPNVVTCYWILHNPCDKRVWMGLERIDGHPAKGTSLREWMSSGPIDLETAIRVAGGVCEAMVYVGSAATDDGATLVHRDLKPENVLLDADGFAKVTDFGLVRRFRADYSGVEVADPVAGTPAYMAPELWKPGYIASVSGDVYAFGIMLWELLTGAHPFDEYLKDRAALRYAHQEVAPRSPRERSAAVPESLASLCLQCLAKDPRQRPAFLQILDLLRRSPQATAWSPRVETDPAVLSAMDGNQIFGLITLARYADAERLLQRALAQDPENPVFHYARLQIYERTGRLAEARDSLERLASLEIRDGSFTAFTKMKALKLLGRLDDALDTVDAALGFEPSQGYLLQERGKLLWALGRAEEALLAFDAASAEGSGWASLVAKSGILSAMGRDEEAHLCLLEALKHNPNDESALCKIALQLAHVGAREKALECADRALKLNPRHYEAWTLKAQLLEEAGRVAEAEEVLRHLLEERPEDLEGCIRLISLLQATGRAVGEHVQAALRSRPRHGEEYLIKGNFLKALGFFREALRSMDAGVALEPGQALGWMWKGDAHVYVSEFDEADLAYRRALSLKPQDAGVRAKIAALGALREGHRLIGNDPRGALELYERAVLSDPDNGTFLFAQAAALGLLGRPGAALPLLDRCVPTLERLSWTPVFEKIRCLAELSLFDEANAMAAEAASQLDPGPDRDRMERIVASGIRSERSRQDVARGWHDMANQHQRAQEFEQAEECFRRATYVNPDEAAHAGALAACLMILSERRPGALAESIAISARVLSRLPDHPPVLFNYAQALHMAGSHQEAFAVAQKLARLTPDDPDLRGLFLGIQAALDRAES